MFIKISQYYRKTPCWSLFLIKLQVWSLQIYQKETPAQMFSCEYCTNFKNTCSEEQLRRAASIVINKVCVRYFWSNFYFQQNDSPSKTMKKCFLFHLKSSFRSWDIQASVFPSSPLFLPVSVRGCLKLNLKVYDVINCLNMNLIIHFVWYLGKEKRYDIETLSID